jgi:hypothetical protein
MTIVANEGERKKMKRANTSNAPYEQPGTERLDGMQQ